MSRIGKMPIEIPAGVEVKLEGQRILISGPKGQLKREIDPKIKIKIEDKKIRLSRASEEKSVKALHGLYRSLISNMVTGVTSGFEKTLELFGVGYRAVKEGKKLILQLGYSHPIEILPPEGIEISCEGTNKIKVSGRDKEVVGQVAADIKAVRPVEPYKGKGVKYLGEYVRRKAGKVAKAAAA